MQEGVAVIEFEIAPLAMTRDIAGECRENKNSLAKA